MNPVSENDIRRENTPVLADFLWKLYKVDAISKYTWTRATRELKRWEDEHGAHQCGG